MRSRLILLFDLLTFFLVWTICYFLRFKLAPGQQGMEFSFLIVGLIQSGITVWFFARLNHYSNTRFSPIDIVLGTVKGNMKAIFMLVVLLYFFYPDRLSRVFLLIYAALSSLAFIFEKLVVQILLVKKANKKDSVILVGNSPALVHLVEHYFEKESERYKHIDFIGWLNPPPSYNSTRIPKLSIDGVNDRIKLKAIDAFYVSFSENDKPQEQAFLKEHLLDLIPIRILIETTPMLLGHSVRSRDGILSIDLNETQHPVHLLFIKRVIDFVGSLFGIMALSPIFIGIAIGIKLSSRGPIFYSQERIGMNGRSFRMWKFRSMKPPRDDEDKTEWANKHNDRRTKFGDFLRKSSLDELPQFFNVLNGTMSLVGPRPERPFFVEKFKIEIPGYMLRHKMPAGISGWAQINGLRGDTSISDRIDHDIYYIKHWSIWLDIQIIFLTFWKSLIDKNA